MLEEIRKGILASIGAVLLTREKAEEISRKMVEEAKLSREDAQKLTEELLATGERQWEEIERSLSEGIRKGLGNLDVGSKTELEKLKDRVENVEKRLSIIEGSIQKER
jgi:polyhydroxyalkanoate synthesis regulator phasin